MNERIDIWWDDEGCWLQRGNDLFGPYATEAEAEAEADNNIDERQRAWAADRLMVADRSMVADLEEDGLL